MQNRIIKYHQKTPSFRKEVFIFLFIAILYFSAGVEAEEKRMEYGRDLAIEPLTLLYVLDQIGHDASNPGDFIVNSVVLCDVDKPECPERDECTAKQCPNYVYMGYKEMVNEECLSECQKCEEDCRRSQNPDCGDCYKRGGGNCVQDCTFVYDVYCKYYSAVSVSVVKQLKERYGVDWGDAENPNCGGITMDMVSESLSARERGDIKIDISEFYPFVKEKFDATYP